MRRPFLGLLALFVSSNVHAGPLPSEAYEKHSAVLIESEDGTGTGTYLGNGLVLTANHVVDNGETKILVSGQNGKRYQGYVLARGEGLDIALVKTDPLPIPPAKVSCRVPRIGEDLTIVANPGSMRFLHFWGRVSGSPFEKQIWKSIFPIDGFMLGGMSGAGVLDTDGLVVAVAVGVWDTEIMPGFYAPVGIGFAVPSSVFCPMLKKAGVL